MFGERPAAGCTPLNMIIGGCLEVLAMRTTRPMSSYHRKRVHSAPPPERVLGRPKIFDELCKRDCEQLVQTEAALNELASAALHAPDTWPAIKAVEEAVVHDYLRSTTKARKDGIAHGRWLCAEEMNVLQKIFEKELELVNQLCAVTTEYEILLSQYIATTGETGTHISKLVDRL